MSVTAAVGATAAGYVGKVASYVGGEVVYTEEFIAHVIENVPYLVGLLGL